MCQHKHNSMRELLFFFFFLSVIAIIGLFSVCLKFIFSFRMPVCMLPDINNTVKKRAVSYSGLDFSHQVAEELSF